MKILVTILSLLCFSTITVLAQKPEINIYNPSANAEEEIHNAVKQAQKENKHVFIQIGGNWCIWCKRFNALVTTDTVLSKQLKDNYVVLHVNYSKENKNLKVLSELEYPQRFGYPVFVILNSKGKRIHTQNSAYLEDGQGYSTSRISAFLKSWSPEALNPKNYND